MQYSSVQEVALNWGITDRRVRVLCDENKIPKVIREGRSYRISTNAIKSIDGRKNRSKNT